MYIFEGTCSEINHPNFLLRGLCKNIRIIQALDNFELKSGTDFLQSCCVENFTIFQKSEKRTMAFSWKKNTLYCQNTFRDSYDICFRFSKDPAVFINLNLFLFSS
jgi:hypothetical protein